MTYFSLVVKGNKFQAAKAASDRKIAFAFESETNEHTIGLSPGSQRQKIYKWSQENIQYEGGSAIHNPPYPIGALLIWSEHIK